MLRHNCFIYHFKLRLVGGSISDCSEFLWNFLFLKIEKRAVFYLKINFRLTLNSRSKLKNSVFFGVAAVNMSCVHIRLLN